jgi:hypothetical protein
LTTALSRLKNIPNSYKEAYNGATNLDNFLQEITKRVGITRNALLEDIFGKATLAKLGEDKLKFLGFFDT